MLQYRGYKAKVDVNQETGKLLGKVLDIADEIPFEGETFKAVEQEFRKSIDAYLEFCSKLGKEPAKPFPGKYLFRTTPEIHREIYLAASLKDQSVNAWTEAVLSEAAREELNNKTKQSLGARTDRTLSLQPLVEESTKFAELIQVVSPYLKNRDFDSTMQLIQSLEKLWLDVEDLHPALNVEEPEQMSDFLIAVLTFFQSLTKDNAVVQQTQGKEIKSVETVKAAKSADYQGIDVSRDISDSVYI
ncbi:MAG: type II toxin-antitoxin system HicB family antitoxin [Drouetiella hepatica Uher 2000/2452]|jgi:predicted HicB family RNase H-like nuclease|uniref:Type II toxin-antitoxin system HicB family antitoxin n=1 Tax=Drouetiella hepatica Uher 2000/2452 TaxID=904376 RepID=A0A951ULI1_9CYAN|nr:type II toxin-antitoxin system HicB family antitoxin [Drouetiella hepatica Uher 2000/2452]